MGWSQQVCRKLYVMCREFVLASAVGCKLGVWGESPMCNTGARLRWCVALGGTWWCCVVLCGAIELLFLTRKSAWSLSKSVV